MTKSSVDENHDDSRGPFDTPLQLFVRSPVFRVKNEQGAVVDARSGHRAALTAPRAAPPRTLVYQNYGVQ